MKKHSLAASLLILACSASLAACGGSDASATTAAPAETTAAEATTEAATEEETTEAEETEAAAEAAELRIGQVVGAAHGTKCFSIGTAVIDADDTIVAAFIDEYQFLDSEQTGVPNSDAFAEAGYIAEGKVLASKRVNNAYYSENMAKAGSTKEIAANYDEIQKFVAGKSISEVEELAGKTPEEVLDAVSGATLADTAGYLGVIADAANAAKDNASVTYEGDLAALTLNVIDAAAHGTKCFTSAAALTDGTNVILSYIDEFQFLGADQIGVPNSDAFAENGDVAAENVLASKRVNNAYYSENMAKAGATKEIAANFDGIQEFANGKTIAELEELSGKPAEEVVDAVSSATLVDAAGYLAAIVEAAKQ